MREDQKFLENKFIIFLSLLQVIIIAFGLYQMLSGDVLTETWILFGITTVTFFLRILFVKRNYFENRFMHTLCKAIILFIYGVFIEHSNSFVEAIALLSYTAIFIEMILLVEPELPGENQNLMVQGGLPLILGFIVHVNLYALTFEVIFNYVFFTVFIIGITYFLSYFISVKLEQQVKLRRMLKEQHFEKESLKLEKSKYKHLHNVMSKQKNELEINNAVLNRISAEMYTQAELLRYISSVLDIEELITLVTDSIIGAIGVDTCMLFIHDQDTGKQYFEVNTSTGKVLINDFKDALAAGLYKEYFTAGKPYMDSNVVSEDYPFIFGREVGSILIVPLNRMGVTYGLLIAEHRTEDMFDDNSLNFFKSITSQISIAVNNANIYMKMEEMAIRDGLTGLYNRREIQKNISDLIFNLKKDESISLALFDIDRFKKVNDTYGHLFGDEAIKAIAELSKRYEREHGCEAGRYGGEEFVIVMPGKTLAEAEVLMNDFHKDIKDITLTYNDTKEVKINVSMGISECPSLANDAEALLSRADNAMYFAKQNGRGQVIVDHENFGKTIQ